MTWGEFKKKMQQSGVTDDTPIDYILYESNDNAIDLAFRADGAVYIIGECIPERAK